MVSDVKTQQAKIIFQSVDLENAAVVAIGDSSFGNAGKNTTASQPDSMPWKRTTGTASSFKENQRR